MDTIHTYLLLRARARAKRRKIGIFMSIIEHFLDGISH